MQFPTYSCVLRFLSVYAFRCDQVQIVLRSIARRARFLLLLRRTRTRNSVSPLTRAYSQGSSLPKKRVPARATRSTSRETVLLSHRRLLGGKGFPRERPATGVTFRRREPSRRRCARVSVRSAPSERVPLRSAPRFFRRDRFASATPSTASTNARVLRAHVTTLTVSLSHACFAS